MIEIAKKFPEFKNSTDSAQVPWTDSVVWVTFENSAENYTWLSNSDISYLSWSNGILSIIPHPDSILSSYFQAILINSPSVLIGKNIKVGN